MENPRSKAIGDQPREEGQTSPDLNPEVRAYIRRPSVKTRLIGRVTKSE